MFGIIDQKREVFNSNFLRTVFFDVKYKLTEKNLEKIEERIKTKFSQDFSIQKSKVGFGFNIKIQNGKQHIEPHNDDDSIGIIMNSLDGKKTIHINKESLRISIQGSVYISFEFNEILINQILNELKDFIELVEKVSIRKINIVEFEKTDETDEPPLNLLNYLLNKDLVGNLNTFNSENTLNFMSNLNLVEKNHLLNLKFGFNSPNNKLEDIKKQIILDIEISKNDDLIFDNLYEEFNTLNLHAFNVFMWSISEEFKAILKK